MFKKILIANRGEIACRVIKTARRMGIATVAVYSDADRNALHVQMADEAVHIGAAPAAESYLLADRIIAACKATGAQAVHPGYGFLSERASFCEALEAEGIAFIGPPPAAIVAMGDKIESKRFAMRAGVSTVPGHDGIIADAEEAARVSDAIGYPVMLKASAGGGGKGMRIAWNRDEAMDGFERARSEAKSSFGDDRVFVEKFIEKPRHIEIQVLADKHGTCIHLGERECSIQRRNQKVLEEAPSPFLDEATRAAMGAQAVALAKAVGYVSAGTVEFIVDSERNFYFLEMNTRLQVEHPVTELITGIDIVEKMIRAAAGEPLGLTQDDIVLNGWAVESRVYAEDPFKGFVPSIGRLVRYEPPAEGARENAITVRNDTGVQPGAEISMFYDPMIAKLCTHGPNRITAIDAMADALDAFVIEGINHNIAFLADIMRQEKWRSGDLTTGYIAQHYPDGVSPRTADEEDRVVLAAVGLSLEIRRKRRLDGMHDRLRAHPGTIKPDWVARIGDVTVDIREARIADEAGAQIYATVGGRRMSIIADSSAHDRVWRGTVDGEPVTAQAKPAGNGHLVTRRGVSTQVQVMEPHVAALAALMPVKLPPDTSKMLISEMPGLVVAINVKVGDTVKAGQTLAVIEAMKMENALKAEKDGTVSSVKAEKGDSLAAGDVLIEFA